MGPWSPDGRSPASLCAVDSEHSALAQCLRSGSADEVSRLVLTASGGPFRGRRREQLTRVTPEQALAHPTWDMGKLITTNSATLVNKGLEVIEAHLLFGVPLRADRVVVHPQSVVHSMVEYIDGATIAQASPPDMRLPIALALGWPDRVPARPRRSIGRRRRVGHSNRSIPRRSPPLIWPGLPAAPVAGAGGVQRRQRGTRRRLSCRTCVVSGHRGHRSGRIDGLAEQSHAAAGNPGYRRRRRICAGLGARAGAGRHRTAVLRRNEQPCCTPSVCSSSLSGCWLSIALHEVGHLVPAKKFGVRVSQYMVGFGPTVWSRRKGDTEYGLKAIPLGGYIRMIGMVPPRADGTRSRWPRRMASAVEEFRNASRAEVEPGDEDRQFYRLTPGKKMIVMLGGPTMNLLIYLVLTVILLSTLGTRHDDATTTVSAVVKCVVPANSSQARTTRARRMRPRRLPTTCSSRATSSSRLTAPGSRNGTTPSPSSSNRPGSLCR